MGKLYLLHFHFCQSVINDSPLAVFKCCNHQRFYKGHGPFFYYAGEVRFIVLL